MPDKPYISPQQIQDCIKVLRSRQTVSGPDILFINFNFFQLIGGSLSDIPVHIPIPCTTFFLASVKSGNENDSIIFHTKPSNLLRAKINLGPTPTGFVPFIAMTSNQAGGSTYRTVIRFKKPIQDFLLDIGTEVGQGPTFTICCVADDAMRLNGGIYRTGSE